MKWIVENWNLITQLITGVVTVASIGAKITPKEVDDNAIGKVIKALDVIGLNTKPTITYKRRF